MGTSQNHQFIFELTSASPVYESYTVSDASPPFFAQRGRAQGSVADNQSTWIPKPTTLGRIRDVCKKTMGFHLVDGAGHWVPQDQPDRGVSYPYNFNGAKDSRPFTAAGEFVSR